MHNKNLNLKLPLNWNIAHHPASTAYHVGTCWHFSRSVSSDKIEDLLPAKLNGDLVPTAGGDGSRERARFTRRVVVHARVTDGVGLGPSRSINAVSANASADRDGRARCRKRAPRSRGRRILHLHRRRARAHARLERRISRLLHDRCVLMERRVVRRHPMSDSV